MKKIFFCISLAFTGLMASCVDKYEEVDAESKPEWLGSSIYAELENPSEASGLKGTFNTYLRLIRDLGQADVLSRTGSKTVFPANDEAFARFFASGGNGWDVSSYEQLSYAQKVLLLKSSMLDNPLLLQLLPNVSNGSVEPIRGQALKHATNVQIIDSVQFIAGKEGLPVNNAQWKQFYETGINVVSDATRPMMVHLTREYMINNNIKFNGEGSDFAIITGSPYPEGSQTAYIFNDKVMVPDVTCQNGYIHQMEDVIVPPGNMAQVLRNKDNTTYMSRILDYFAVPVLSTKITNDYNTWARANNLPEKTDGIYQWRYLSSRSYDGDAGTETILDRIGGKIYGNSQLLSFDPGWNQYYPTVVQAGGRDVSIMDIAAFFVPSDEAVKDYFLPSQGDKEKGHGAYLIDIYGNYKGAENTVEHLGENLDSLHSKNPQVLTAFLKNLMKSSFVESVPSKFENVLNDAAENMGLSVDLIQKNGSKYDVTMANNGAVYVLNKMIAPDEYQAVLAPASVYPDMRVMNWAVQDRGSDSYHLGLDFKFYLLAMKANYAFFIPEDSAFKADFYYLDPATLGHRENNLINGPIRPDVLHFWYDEASTTQPPLKCERYAFDMETGQLVGEPSTVKIADVKTQLVDMLNYHTIVLNAGSEIGQNKYYKTKHGGEVYVDGSNTEGTHVMSGLQIDKTYFDAEANQKKGRKIEIQGIDAPAIVTKYPEKNGHAYRLNRVIQAPVESVYGALKGAIVNGDSVFSEFLSLCMGFSATDVLRWAGISDQKKETGGTDQDAYIVFTSDYKMGETSITNACLDYNVKMFNTYNYTLFAPDNNAMSLAHQRGLPKWSSDDPNEETIAKLYQEYVEKVENSEDPSNYEDDAEDIANKDKALSMIKAMRDFARFHFVTNSVYADNTIESGRYKTLSSDEMGVAKEIRLSGSGGQLTIEDREQTHTVTVNAADMGPKMINKMTRDYWFNANKMHASSIVTSSFCAVHQISEPLCSNQNGRYDNNIAHARKNR